MLLGCHFPLVIVALVRSRRGPLGHFGNPALATIGLGSRAFLGTHSKTMGLRGRATVEPPNEKAKQHRRLWPKVRVVSSPPDPGRAPRGQSCGCAGNLPRHMDVQRSAAPSPPASRGPVQRANPLRPPYPTQPSEFRLSVAFVRSAALPGRGLVALGDPSRP